MADEQGEHSRALALEFIRRLSEGNTAGFLSLYHPEAQLWTSGNTLISGYYSREEIENSATLVLDAFPEGLRFTVQATTAEGERISIEAN